VIQGFGAKGWRHLFVAERNCQIRVSAASKTLPNSGSLRPTENSEEPGKGPDLPWAGWFFQVRFCGINRGNRGFELATRGKSSAFGLIGVDFKKKPGSRGSFKTLQACFGSALLLL
jgi:hypothetical protein